MIIVGILLVIVLFFSLCCLANIGTELQKIRLENRELINIINKTHKNK